jgi:hypothetical protein
MREWNLHGKRKGSGKDKRELVFGRVSRQRNLCDQQAQAQEGQVEAVEVEKAAADGEEIASSGRGSFSSPVIRLFGCSVIRLFGCSVVQLFGCSVDRLFGSGQPGCAGTQNRLTEQLNDRGTLERGFSVLENEA